LSVAAAGLGSGLVVSGILANVESVGGLLIVAVGINFIAGEERISVVDLLPALGVSALLAGFSVATGVRML
jgi:uncharacterized membrane protein YqgA involved in biofilm formation